MFNYALLWDSRVVLVISINQGISMENKGSTINASLSLPYSCLSDL